ncbi:T9SS type A sorting domain-containing protein [Fluviicola chungangensis]|uniref:T9SS type A sorting domain-containing protein n=1 Tax=Fluviicola chungangensis TaxID=2597671 RepID=A0A556MZV0_9FLAO|nr:T9SS type A sorting domain-containing protein [Fluviicola chungangensis]TSJ45447.1 T9SS type A sorting domain-containing protein [Fluviicola chungangensis]
MKKELLFSLLLFVSGSLFAQDTLVISKRQLADSVYGLLNAENIPTGKLFNRQFFSTKESTLFHFSDSNAIKNDTINPDYIYNSLHELEEIVLSKGSDVDSWTLFDSVQAFCANEDFDYNRVIIPITYIDKRYNYFDDSSALASGLTYLNGYNQMDENDNSIVQPFEEKRLRLAGPLYNFMSADVFNFYVKREWLVVDSIEQIDHFSIGIGNYWYELPFDTYLPIKAPDSLRFNFRIRVHFKSNSLEKGIWEDAIEFLAEYSNLTPTDEPHSKKICNEDNEIAHGKNKLQWCLVHGCTDRFFEADKPFILLTGYRPPIISQSFDKSYDNYSTYHNALLEILREQALDIYIVRFNIFSQTQNHGIVESAYLLKDFIHYVNDRKATASSMGAYNENVILAASMSCDVARLTLLMMEREHADNGANHHHTRLLISYDGNFYGANIPLTTQAALYSNRTFSKPLTLSPTLLHYMYGAMYQKTTKQLLTYHIANANENPFTNPWVDLDIIPGPNNERVNFLNFTAAYDNGVYFIPMPQKMRHIAVSLGKISGTDNENTPNGLEFNDPGENWVDLNYLLEKYILRSAKYAPPGSFTKIFQKNSLISQSWISFLLPIFWVKHQLHVSEMLEVDNAGGSYLPKFGNALALTNFALFGGNQSKIQFSHKSVVTALAINPNLWPADGSLRVNVQDLDLMYRKFDIVNNPQSNYYGYPHLGRPNDYRQITPFDAIYIDNNINPHINLEEDIDADSDSLRDFLLNEIEPWYLGLQNFKMGDQARSNYLYKAKRRAKVAIRVGNHVTPSTPDGWYQVMPNADLVLNAGEYIELEEGFETEFGAQFTAEIDYYQCSPDRLAPPGGVSETEQTNRIAEPDSRWLNGVEATESEEPELRLYPNPTTGRFTLDCTGIIKTVTCFTVMGNPVFQCEVGQASWESDQELKPGTYILRCLIDNRWQQQKLVVL